MSRGVRVIGSLQGALLKGLFRALSGHFLLNLSEIHKADESAVRILAQLPPDRCRIVECPEWLMFLIEQERHSMPREAVA
jgi:hypothetical protein